MTAFNSKIFPVLENSVAILKERWMALHTDGITHEEFLSAYAPPEHWTLLRDADEIAHVYSAGSVHVGRIFDERLRELAPSNEASILFCVSEVNGRAPLRPRNDRILDTCPQHVRDKLTSWVIEQVKVGYDFSRIRMLLHWLNNNCNSPYQARYIWPSVVALCALSEETKDFGHKLREVRPPRALPHISQDIRAALKLSAGTVATASLLPPAETAPFFPVSLRLQGFTAKKEGDLGFLSAT
jgi:hypothetical protein